MKRITVTPRTIERARAQTVRLRDYNRCRSSRDEAGKP
jgi:hypothetical protein